MKHDATDHPKFHAFKAALKLKRYEAIGILEGLWHIAQKFAPDDGDLSRFTPLEIAGSLEWDGDPEALIKALVATRWLNPDMTVHDWADHAPGYLRERWRWRKRQAETPNKPANLQETPGDSRRLRETPPLNPTQPNPTHTEEAEAASCPEPVEATDSRPSDPAVVTIEVVGRDPGLVAVRQSKVAEWREAYPGVDVVAELRKARQWCLDNPDRRKTRQGLNRFLGSWLARAQNNARASPARGAPVYVSGGDHVPRGKDFLGDE